MNTYVLENRGAAGVGLSSIRSIEQQFDALIEKNGGKIFNTVYSVFGDAALAEDVTQDIFLEAYRALPKFEGRSSLSTWLYRISMNVISDHMGRKKKHQAMTSPNAIEDEEAAGKIAGAPTPVESRLERRELGGRIRGALMRLPENFRLAFVMKEVDGHSYREIAEILKISIGTVESRLFRAREILRKELSEAPDFGE